MEFLLNLGVLPLLPPLFDCVWDICLLYHGNNNEVLMASGRRGQTRDQKPRSRQVQTNLYGAAGNGAVKVPKIYWKYCTKGVLTMEWIEGIKLTDREALLASGFDINNLVDQVLL